MYRLPRKPRFERATPQGGRRLRIPICNAALVGDQRSVCAKLALMVSKPNKHSQQGCVSGMGQQEMALDKRNCMLVVSFWHSFDRCKQPAFPNYCSGCLSLEEKINLKNYAPTNLAFVNRNNHHYGCVKHLIADTVIDVHSCGRNPQKPRTATPTPLAR